MKRKSLVGVICLAIGLLLTTQITSAVAETVEVTVGPSATVATESASVSTTKTCLRYVPRIAPAKRQLFTPRHREYFPETLLWTPELTTDKKGRAQLDFKLADNITTWKMSVIGSTADGAIGTAETEIRSFQPFFADLDPPRALTEGDRISLPVVLRNYLDRKQTDEYLIIGHLSLDIFHWSSKLASFLSPADQ